MEKEIMKGVMDLLGLLLGFGLVGVTCYVKGKESVIKQYNEENAEHEIRKLKFIDIDEVRE